MTPMVQGNNWVSFRKQLAECLICSSTKSSKVESTALGILGAETIFFILFKLIKNCNYGSSAGTESEKMKGTTLNNKDI